MSRVGATYEHSLIARSLRRGCDCVQLGTQVLEQVSDMLVGKDAATISVA